LWQDTNVSEDLVASIFRVTVRGELKENTDIGRVHFPFIVLSNLKMEAARSSETLVSDHHTTESHELHLHRCVKPQISRNTRVYPKVSGLATWSENCKC
jgi:hypothetical protein